MTRDGSEALKVACRLGILELPRHICYNAAEGGHTLPGNAVLPTHQGMVITRNLQEIACLLALDVPFETAQRLLVWETREAEMICTTEIRRLVRIHGEIIRAAEAAEVQELLARDDLSTLHAQLVEAPAPRRPAAWAAEIQTAVEQALEAETSQAPEGVQSSDWERVLCARREERLALHQLRRLGPTVQPDQAIAAVDDIEVRRPARRRFLALRTARFTTRQGIRYLSGSAELVLTQLYLLCVVSVGLTGRITVLGDGARWISTFFRERLADFVNKELLVDWYHLVKKCYELTGMICRGRKAKASLMGQLIPLLWRGKVAEALLLLEAYRAESRNTDKLDELCTYLTNRQPYIVDYKESRAQREYIGSGHAEKANDLIVARRQKHQGMHWSLATADGLAALKTLDLNHGWDRYWSDHQVLPLAISA